MYGQRRSCIQQRPFVHIRVLGESAEHDEGENDGESSGHSRRILQRTHLPCVATR